MFKLFQTIPFPIWVLALAHGSVDMAGGAFYVALPFIKAKFGLAYAEVTAIVLVQNLTSSIVQPLFGYLSDRKPRPWLMPVGCLVLGLTLPTIFFAPNYYFLFLLTAINGLGSAAFHPQAAKTVSLLSGAAKGKALSIFSVGGSVGIAVGSIFLASLLLGGPGSRLLLYSLPYILVSLALFRLVARLPRLEPQHRRQGSARLKSYVNWPLLAFMGMVLTRATIASGISTFVPLYYISYLNGSPLYASFLLSVFQSAGVIGTLLGGIMSDRYGSRQVMIFSILPIAPLLYFFRIVSDIWVFAVLAASSILLAATATSGLVLIQKMMPHNLGMASGLNLGLGSGLGAVGVLSMGWIADTWGVPRVFDLLSWLPVLGFVLTLFIREPADKTSKQAGLRHNCSCLKES
ncbi:MAG TPA: MFS transporter [Methylomusa anaerophila]|uniref:Fosmidomycin resistance protein n=1 Tax=Methylomusa anaerophila TaxID=1930071 RepID=A0A348AI62_9FIRM|nr:MFS transporter [Methylomusa anaerophila]BBB90760.1 fosmidomycin resistance protein [Methylomusa anaerophila]HML88637.1 MFS transporter [Methylomusa anaerophila]